MVNKSVLDRTLEYIAKQPNEEFDSGGYAWVYLISAQDGGSVDEYDAHTLVGISYLIPRVYSLLQGPGWLNIYDQRCP